MILKACFIVLHLVTDVPFHHGSPLVINTAFIVAVTKTEEGNTLTLANGELKIKETPEEVLEQQKSKCGG